MWKRVAKVIVGVLAGWLVVLWVLGIAIGSHQERKTVDRLAESLQAIVTIDDSNLALIRGRWSMERLAVRHDDPLGKLSIDVAGVRCELGPLGWALVDRDCSELAVTGVRMEVSSTQLFKVPRPKRKPIHAEHIVIDDAVLVFQPSAVMPSLGRIEIAIEHAESGPTTLRTPLSWLLTLETLRAKLELPAGITLHLSYAKGVLTASGSLFGSAPVELPVQLPVVALAHDTHEEMQQLIALGKDIAERLVAKRATDWLESKLKRPAIPPPSGSAAP
ncbi:MAG TPA: hypothetical protein VFV99_06230 [Kofleriaceae bacterium]|nr:hypothetical protein [Kofleriaceae bacterium]